MLGFVRLSSFIPVLFNRVFHRNCEYVAGLVRDTALT